MNALQALLTTAYCLSRIEWMLTEEYDYEVLAAVRLARKEVENMAAEERAKPGTHHELNGIGE
jgi:porphobilinogen deaminase